MDAPSWLIAVVLVMVFLASVEAGWRLHDALNRRAETGGQSAGAGYLVAASLGLLSLLLSFTLARSLDRYELRRHLVVDEANAIASAWQRDQLFDQPARGQLDALLRAYVKERRALPGAGVSRAALDAADARAGALQQQIWQATAAALRAPDAATLTTPVLQATGAMFDFTTTRRAALDAVVPPPVVWTLVIVAIFAAASTGYGLAAAGHRHRLASSGLFISVALIMTLIFELDEPRTGLIRVPQTPMERVASAILSAPPPN